MAPRSIPNPDNLSIEGNPKLGRGSGGPSESGIPSFMEILREMVDADTGSGRSVYTEEAVVGCLETPAPLSLAVVSSVCWVVVESFSRLSNPYSLLRSGTVSRVCLRRRAESESSRGCCMMGAFSFGSEDVEREPTELSLGRVVAESMLGREDSCDLRTFSISCGIRL